VAALWVHHAGGVSRDHKSDLVAGCSAPLSCGVTACSGLDTRRAARRILQIMIITGLLAAAAGCLVLMLAGTVYVLLILIIG
jgi:hypothetical protein